jgi:hypothetical protein
MFLDLTVTPETNKVLLLQDDKYSGLVDRFFEEYPHPRVSWLHDVHIGRYHDASQSLLQESHTEKQLDVKHVGAWWSTSSASHR